MLISLDLNNKKREYINENFLFILMKNIFLFFLMMLSLSLQLKNSQVGPVISIDGNLVEDMDNQRDEEDPGPIIDKVNNDNMNSPGPIINWNNDNAPEEEPGPVVDINGEEVF